MGRTSIVTKILLGLAFLAAVGVRGAYFRYIHPDSASSPATRPAATAAPETAPATQPTDVAEVTTRPAAATAEEQENAFRAKMWQKEGYYGVVARNLLDGRGFAGWAPLSGRRPWQVTEADPPPPTAFVAPGYPVLMAGILTLFGETNFAALFYAQCIIGALGCIFAFYLARRIFQSTLVGWVACAAMTVSFFLVPAVIRVHPPVVASTMITLSLLTIVAAADTKSLLRYLLAGLVTGLAVLVVPAFLVVLPFAFVWMISYGEGSGAQRFGLSLLYVLVFLAVVAPWTARNYLALERPVPVADSFGYHVWVGNNPKANGGDHISKELTVQKAALTNADRRRYVAIENEVDRFRQMGRDAWDWAQEPENRYRAVQLRFHTYVYFWLGRSAWVGSSAGADDELPLLLGAMLLLLALIGIGVGKNTRQRSRVWLIYIVLLLYPIPYALSHVTALATSRLPLDPLLVILAAYAVASFVTGGRVAKEKAKKAEGQDEMELEPRLLPLA